MDESFQELENELLNLRPRRPSRALEARIDAVLAENSQGAAPAPATAAVSVRPHARRPLGWSLAALAAVGLLAALASRIGPNASVSEPAVAQTPAAHPPAPPARDASSTGFYRPVGAASVLYDLKEDGNVMLSDNTPARTLRYRFVDTYTWKNPATNASLKWSVPRDEIRVLPASLH